MTSKDLGSHCERGYRGMEGEEENVVDQPSLNKDANTEKSQSSSQQETEETSH